MTTEIDDAQVLAELRKDELRVWHAPVTTVGGRHLQTVFRNTFTRLALSRIEAREAAAREREEIAALVDEHCTHWGGATWRELVDLAARIRARGQS